jgi:HSP20 family molecular chaperone IbpA
VLTEDVKATLKNDILQIVLPKSKPKEARSVKIDLS